MLQVSNILPTKPLKLRAEVVILLHLVFTFSIITAKVAAFVGKITAPDHATPTFYTGLF